MDKYGLSLAELQEISSPADACEVDVTPIGKRRAHEVLHLSPAIALYTDTRSWYNRHGLFHDNKGKWRKHEHDGIILSYFGLSGPVLLLILASTSEACFLDRLLGPSAEPRERISCAG